MGAQVIALCPPDESAAFAELEGVEGRLAIVRGLCWDAAREMERLEQRIVTGDLVNAHGEPLKAVHRLAFLVRLRKATREWHDLLQTRDALEARVKALCWRLGLMCQAEQELYERARSEGRA